MVLQILAHTPFWVFGLFIALLAFGLLQTRTRTVRQVPALLLPAGMIALSLAGIGSGFGFAPLPLAAWALALALAALAGRFLLPAHGMAYDGTTRQFTIAGSWVPLVVIMAIFFAKYLHAVLRAYHHPMVSTTPFVVGLSAAYGLLSGYFAARAWRLIELSPRG